MTFITPGKVVFLGNAGVGKTAIINCISKSGNNDPSPTLGASTISVKASSDGEFATMQIWDTAGQEAYKCLLPLYVRGAQVAILVFDVSNEDSFVGINDWVDFVSSNGNVQTVILVANKIDLDRRVPVDDVLQYSERTKFAYIETSAVTGEGILELVSMLVHLVKQAGKIEEPEFVDPIPQEEPNDSGCKC